jgi:hypothetical protein
LRPASVFDFDHPRKPYGGCCTRLDGAAKETHPWRNQSAGPRRVVPVASRLRTFRDTAGSAAPPSCPAA